MPAPRQKWAQWREIAGALEEDADAYVRQSTELRHAANEIRAAADALEKQMEDIARSLYGQS